MDKLCKRFGLNVKFLHSHSGSHEVGYYCEWQDISVDIKFSRRTILCWTSTGVRETISHNQFYKVY